MSKEMIVSVNGREKKIAILDNGRVTEFYIERGEENAGVVGNVYKGRVMRVLPGMQSAFVDIGLDRDAFLYVSDFFDEEEEIERIVMEKSKQSTPEDAKREADDQIARARLNREKQMEAVQEIAEPLQEAGDERALDEFAPSESETRVSDDVLPEPERKGRSRTRGRKGRDTRPADEPKEQAAPVFEFESDDSGFERVKDDEDTGEIFKDAFMQEAIVHRVRAVEFDMESSSTAEVGSLIGSVSDGPNGFERIADDDDETPERPSDRGKGRSRAARTDEKDDGTGAASAEKPKSKTGRKSPAKKAATSKGKFSKSSVKAKKSADGEALQDSEASERESGDIAEMAVRRGGRGRRRGGRPNETDLPDDSSENQEPGENASVEAASLEPVSEIVELAVVEPEVVKERDSADDRPGGDHRRSNGKRERGGRPSESGKRFERDDRSDRTDRGRRDRPPQPAISDLLREGQEILVQIAKEPIAAKGARITSHIAMPGRYLVYMPTIEHLGVSRKIESASERSRLRTLIQRIRQDVEIPSGGFIVRTAGVGISEEDLRNDAKYLARTWIEKKKNSEKKKSPALVHQDLDLVQRILRDQLSDDFTAIRVDSEEEYLRTVEFINLIQPRMVKRVKLYTRDEPILDAYNVQEDIDKALKPRVWLKSGGYLVINQTEALVAIDVNTGKFVGKGNARLEDTITRTNMEAVDEIARQIRLRDLGGIIVLDLIDMEDRRNRNKVSQALQEALASDKSPNKVLSFNDFGLIIMTRKRVKQSLERTMCTPCDNCEGAGWVKSPPTVCYEILAEARRLSRSVEDVRQTTLRVHPDVSKALRNSEREVFDEIEAYLGNVDINSDPRIHQGQFDFAFV